MRFYPVLFNTVFRRMEPEKAHHLAFPVIKAAGVFAPIARAICAADPRLRVRALGLDVLRGDAGKRPGRDAAPAAAGGAVVCAAL